MSLSSGEPNGTNWSSLASRNSRLVVSSNLFVMWSSESAVPYLDDLSFSTIWLEYAKFKQIRYQDIPSKNMRARRLTKTDPANTPVRKRQWRTFVQKYRSTYSPEGLFLQLRGALYPEWRTSLCPMYLHQRQR